MLPYCPCYCCFVWAVRPIYDPGTLFWCFFVLFRLIVMIIVINNNKTRLLYSYLWFISNIYFTCTLHVHVMYITMHIVNAHYNVHYNCTVVVHYNVQKLYIAIVHWNVHYNVHDLLYIECTFDAHSMFITMYIVMNNTMYIKCTVKCTPQCSTTSNVHRSCTTNHVQRHLHPMYISCTPKCRFLLADILSLWLDLVLVNCKIFIQP